MFRLFRRFLWFGTGAGVGFGGAVWIRHKMRRAVERYRPARVVGGSMRRVGGDLRDALSEGRQAMQAREAALRDELSQPPR